MSPVPGDPHWYCRRSGQVFGPFSTEELEDLITMRSLAEYDFVRLGMNDQWLRVADVRQMFEQAATAGASFHDPEDDGPQRPDPDAVQSASQEPESKTTFDASHAAAEALSHAALARLRACKDQQATSCKKQRGPNVLDAALTAVVGVIGGLLSWLALQIWGFVHRRAAQVGLAAVVITLVYWLVVLPRLPVSAPSVLAEYARLWTEIQESQQRETPTSEWDRLEGHVTATVNRFQDRLERYAGSKRPAVQELVWATELLPAAFREAREDREDASPASAKLSIHLENAQRLLARQAELAAENPAPAESAASDGLFWGMVAIDAFVLVGVTLFVLRKHSSRRSRRVTA